VILAQELNFLKLSQSFCQTPPSIHEVKFVSLEGGVKEKKFIKMKCGRLASKNYFFAVFYKSSNKLPISFNFWVGTLEQENFMLKSK